MLRALTLALIGIALLVNAPSILKPPAARAEQTKPAKSPADLWLQLRKTLWPKHSETKAPPPSTPKAKPGKRKQLPQAQPAPRSADPAPVPIARGKPKLKKPPQVRAKPKVKQAQKIKPAQKTKPEASKPQSISKADCKRLRDAVATYGHGIVDFNARLRGYSDDQIAWAKRRCYLGVR